MKRFAFSVAVAALAFCGQAAAQDALDLERTPYSFAFDTYEDWLDFMDKAPDPAWQADAMRTLVPEATFEAYQDGRDVRAERIEYTSEGLRIKGFMAAARECEATACPVILYAQGGVAQWSRITFFDVLEMHRLAAQGYVVLATTRRGEGGSEGEPNMGAGALADVMALFDIADSLPDADGTRIHYLGFSRGAALGFRLIAETDRIRSAAMIGAPTDAVLSPRRAEFDEAVYPGIVDNYEADPDAALRALSVLYWPERLSDGTSFLFLHGGRDWRVRPQGVLKLAERLQGLGRSPRLVLFEDGSHSLIEHYPDVRREVDRWFSKTLDEME